MEVHRSQVPRLERLVMRVDNCEWIEAEAPVILLPDVGNWEILSAEFPA